MCSSTRQQIEGSGNAQNNTVSRRSTRLFCEEEQNELKKIGQSQSSGDEMDPEKVIKVEQRTSVAPNVAAAPIFKPVTVNVGLDITNLFPSRMEDRDKQVMSVLHGAKTSTKSKTDARPINFGNVIPGVFRSSFPAEEDFEYLSTLGLKTILSLVKKDFSQEFLDFMKNNDIRHVVIDMQGTKKVDIPLDVMNSIMEIALEKENHPLLIHCNHGKHRTGCAVAVIRHVAGWNVDSILEEYRGFAEPKIRECDINYISHYKVSSLQGLFLRRAQRIRRLKNQVLDLNEKRRRMSRLILFTAAYLLLIMATVYFW